MSIPAGDERPSILIIEDDANIAALLEIHLRDTGYRVEVVSDGRTGLDKALTRPYALVVLDLMLPGLEGIEVCKRIRAQDASLPILMLTARSEEVDKVLGLELGADDYITKPFSIRELIARIKALFRRIEVEQEKGAPAPVTLLSYGDLRIDVEKRKATLRGVILDLTAKEWELLLLFAQHPGRVYSRQELLDLIWGYQYEGYSHTVNSHINRLRNKIEEDPSRPFYLKTKRGLGYHFVEPEDIIP